jgi:uncharacterized protein (TIGR00251 family)
MPSFLQETEGGVIIRVHVQPRASRNEVTGAHGDAIKIRVTSPPVGGAANTRLLAFLAKKLGIPRSRLELRAGSTSRVKYIAVREMSAAEVRQRLGEGL